MLPLRRGWLSNCLLVLMLTAACAFGRVRSNELVKAVQVLDGSEIVLMEDSKVFKRSTEEVEKRESAPDLPSANSVAKRDFFSDAPKALEQQHGPDNVISKDLQDQFEKTFLNKGPKPVITPTHAAESHADLDMNDTLANVTTHFGDSSDTMANLILFEKKFKSQIVIPLNEIIQNASDFANFFKNDQNSSGDGNQVELELEGPKEDMEAMRDDLKAQVDALQELSTNAEQLQIEGETLLIEVTKTQADLERQIGEAEKEMDKVAQELNATEALVDEHEKAFNGSEKEVEAAQEEAAKAYKESEDTKTNCLTKGIVLEASKLAPKHVRKRFLKKWFNSAKNWVKKTADKYIPKAHKFVCENVFTAALEKAEAEQRHAENVYNERKANLDKDKKLLDSLKNKTEMLAKSLESIIAEKNATSKHMEKIKRKTSAVSQVQSKLKLRQMEISDLHVKLEALMKNVEIDMLRQGIEKVANIANDLKSYVEEEEDD